MKRLALASAGLLMVCANAAAADNPVQCAGAAMLGAAQLVCSHVDNKAPAQLCTFTWSLHSNSDGAKVEDGTFLLQPGAKNVMVYQASGFDSALSQPIVLCHGRKDKN